jgi:hypothetical protein
MARGFSAELYFEYSNHLGVISYRDSQPKGGEVEKGTLLYQFYNNKDDKSSQLSSGTRSSISKANLKILIKTLFLTISSNYSVYSLLAKDYQPDRLIYADTIDYIDNQWIRDCYKADSSYLFPLRFVPSRNEEGVLNMSDETEQTRIRLATIALLFKSQNKPFMDNYEISDIIVRLPKNRAAEYHSLFSRLVENNIDTDGKTMAECRKLILAGWKNKILHNSRKIDKLRDYYDCTLHYLCYLTLKFCLDSFEFGGHFILKEKDGNEYEIDLEDDMSKNHFTKRYTMSVNKQSVDDLIRYIEDSAEYNPYILKIHQALEDIKKGFYARKLTNAINSEEHVEISIDEVLSVYLPPNKNNKKARFNSYNEAYISLPPDYVDWDIRLRKKQTNKQSKQKRGKILLSQLSSGEKQLLNCFGNVVYHLKNLESLELSYRRVLLIFDEAELYYHPEYQRTLIQKLIGMLKWCCIDGRNISELNITVITHSPFVLSDIPVNHILFLQEDKDGFSQPNSDFSGEQTFGANTYNILHNQFFMRTYIGSVAENAVKYIQEIYQSFIEGTSAKKDEIRNKYAELKTIAGFIGEDYLRRRLLEMVEEMAPSVSPNVLINEKIARLQAQIDNLKKKLS